MKSNCNQRKEYSLNTIRALREKVHIAYLISNKEKLRISNNKHNAYFKSLRNAIYNITQMNLGLGTLHKFFINDNNLIYQIATIEIIEKYITHYVKEETHVVPNKKEPKLPVEMENLFKEGEKLSRDRKQNEAGEMYLEALLIAKDQENEYGIAKGMMLYARLLNQMHEDSESALVFAKKAENYFRDNQLVKELAYTLYELSISEFFIGHLDRARIYLKEAVSLSIELNNKSLEASCYFQMGCMEQDEGHLNKSKEFYGKAIEILETQYHKEDKEEIILKISACYHHLALVSQSEMNTSEEESHFLKSLDYARQSNSNISIGECLYFLAELNMRIQNFDVGQKYLQEAGLIFEEMKQYSWLAKIFDLLSQLFDKVGKSEEAIEVFYCAFNLNEQEECENNKLYYYLKLAKIYVLKNKYSDAEDIYLQIINYTNQGNLIDEYCEAISGLAGIKRKKKKESEYNEISKKGIEKLKQFLVEAQSEFKRAHILLNIASLYLERENYIETKKYFSLSKEAYIKLSDKKGISSCLLGLAHVYNIEGDFQREAGIYIELKQLTESTHDYYTQAASTFYLCIAEIENHNFELAKRYFSEIEYLNYKYGLNIQEKIEILELYLNKIEEIYVRPDNTIKELIHDFYSEINYYSDERIHHLRFWIFFNYSKLFASFTCLEGLKFLIISDNTDLFLNISSKFYFIGELFLQSYNLKITVGKATVFHYPKERMRPKGLRVLAIDTEKLIEELTIIKSWPRKKTKMDYEEEKIGDSVYKMSHTGKLHNYSFIFKDDSSKMTAKVEAEFRKLYPEFRHHPGNLILGYPLIFPEPFEQLLLNSTADEIIKRKIFFEFSFKIKDEDRLCSDLIFASQCNMIPIYIDNLPKSSKVFVMETAQIELPIFNQQSAQLATYELNKLKTILGKFCHNVGNSRFSLQNLKFDVDEIIEKMTLSKVKLVFYVLELFSQNKKIKMVALVLPT